MMAEPNDNTKNGLNIIIPHNKKSDLNYFWSELLTCLTIMIPECMCILWRRISIQVIFLMSHFLYFVGSPRARDNPHPKRIVLSNICQVLSLTIL